ncbi:MAG: STAS-like domain-containing protein [Elusimicrobiota bacterium]|jgi:hypothetical protein|nr:STAS-like domain-containing protein [Elusimicrobiota bacterium]
MRIDIGKFGNALISRPEGREAFLSARAYILKKDEKEFVLDFINVEVLTPSWADEFISAIKKEFVHTAIIYENTTNPSVQESLKWVSN